MTTYDFLIKDKVYKLDALKKLCLENLLLDFSLIKNKIQNCKNKQELISFSSKLEKLGLLK